MSEIEKVARAIYDSLQKASPDWHAPFLDPFVLDEPVVIDGEFDLRIVAEAAIESFKAQKPEFDLISGARLLP